MGKARVLSVFFALMMMIGVAATPVTAAAADKRDFFNPFPKILEQFTISKDSAGKQNSQTTQEIAEGTTTPNELPLYTAYEVTSRDDSLMMIAQLYRVSVSDIVKANPWIDGDPEIGQIVYIPMTAALVHHVFWGDTLYSIATQYGVGTQSLIDANPQINMGRLRVNQEIHIPQSVKNKQVVKVSNVSKVSAVYNAMAWPVTGTITSPYGPRWGRFHQGIDIWNEQEYKTPIGAALSGTVAFADWSGSGYGRLVILDHGNGIQTYYAHMSRISVAEGQKVRQGDTLGYMGSSGDSLGIHLHYEVRVDERPVNPLPYLP